ncbi:DUF4123 domain-containing protein [Chondromyces crocatus]|uniref:FHA domain-containing protein n=1 Tax=Chondromyces crocatus TaxID=52 RepID=A0A0K1EPZ1_CHOCO|nr:DUF4123 domain-containing protein [Chondromyces crocatus]AKT42884.1 uncharacterized protein CMC5_071120 [Chondromyces crocatus]
MSVPPPPLAMSTFPHLLLEIRLGPRRGTKGTIPPGGSLRVGRSPDAGLVIADDPQISVEHFELTWVDGKATLRDLNSLGGTRLHGDPVQEAEVSHGAWISAGSTDFVAYVEGHTEHTGSDDDEAGDDDELEEDDGDDGEPPPFAAEERAPPPEEQEEAAEAAARREAEAALRKVWAVERRQAREAHAARVEAATAALPLLQRVATARPLHVVLDAARTPRILTVLQEAIEEYTSLYEGVKGEVLDQVAPRLVELRSDSRLLAQLVREGWGRRWGIFLEGDVSGRELRRHLRRFLMVEDDDTGEKLYFRYYDPKVLREFWPTCSAQERATLLGSLDAFLVEGERGEFVRLTEGGIEAPD